MKKLLGAFLSNESGVTAVEYGAVVAFIGLSLVLVLEGIGLNIKDGLIALKAAVASVLGGAAG